MALHSRAQGRDHSHQYPAQDFDRVGELVIHHMMNQYYLRVGMKKFNKKGSTAVSK